MKDFLSNKYFQIAIRIILGIVFIYASVGKLFRPEDFALAIDKYELVPKYIAHLMGIVLPWTEFFTGVLLITGIFKKATSLLASISLVVFIIALTSAFARGLDINCGCFSLEETSSKGDIIYRIIQDIFMLAGAIIVYRFSDIKKIEEPLLTD